MKIYGVHCNPNKHDSLPFYEEVAEMSGNFFTSLPFESHTCILGGICLSLKHLQLITDMFKAVCYREFGAEVLSPFILSCFFRFFFFLLSYHLLNISSAFGDVQN